MARWVYRSVIAGLALSLVACGGATRGGARGDASVETDGGGDAGVAVDATLDDGGRETGAVADGAAVDGSGGGPADAAADAFGSIADVGQRNVGVAFPNGPVVCFDPPVMIDGGTDAGAATDGGWDGSCPGGVVSGNLTITSADDIAALAGCHTIEGRLTVESPTLESLEGLEGIQRIEGDLWISGRRCTRACSGSNELLTSLRGLDDLAFVGGTVDIRGDMPLTDIDGLDGLVEIGERLTISVRGVTAISGLGSLEAVGRGLSLSYASIERFDALNALTTVRGTVSFFENPGLVELGGFDAVRFIDGHLSFERNDLLRDVTGFASLERIGCGIAAHDNPVLLASKVQTLANRVEVRPCREGVLACNLRVHTVEQAQSLSACETALGWIRVEQSDLVDLSGFENLRDVGNLLSIFDNPRLVSLRGLEGLRTVRGSLGTRTNPVLRSTEALAGLEQVAQLYIEDNQALNMLGGFDALDRVCQITIRDNPALGTISGFDALLDAPHLLIEDNVSLRSIYGFSSLSSPVATNLELENNESLATIAGLAGFTRARWLRVMNSPGLASLVGLHNIAETTDHVRIVGLGVTDLRDLASLERVGSDFVISDNARLTSLEGLESLATVDGDLRLERNGVLTDLTGLVNLVSAGRVVATDNVLLPHCDAVALATRLGLSAALISGNLGTGPCP